MIPIPIPFSMAPSIATPSMALARRQCVQLRRQAQRHDALVEITPDQEVEIRLLFEELGAVLAGGDNAAAVPRVPFHLGGTFHPDNLELVVEPEPADLAAKRTAHPPALQPSATVSLALDGETLNHQVLGVDWDPDGSEWVLQVGEGYDGNGNLVSLGGYASEHLVLQRG
jgi:hypothetical protein